MKSKSIQKLLVVGASAVLLSSCAGYDYYAGGYPSRSRYYGPSYYRPGYNGPEYWGSGYFGADHFGTGYYGSRGRDFGVNHAYAHIPSHLNRWGGHSPSRGGHH
ncbi:MAG TPA: hypothetical protein VG735_06155 [Caulobacterales bacterium]|nr:hypothetical protein [Caulobacterales bacterium]